MAYQKHYQARKALTPAQQLQAALTRAEKARAEGADLRVIAIGKRLADGAPVYFVPSQSVAGMWHAVIQSGKGLACDCYASAQRGQVCTHRAVVYLYLKAQAEAARPSVPAPKAQPAPARQPTEAEARALAARREAAPLYRSNEDFSLFKSGR